MEWPADPFATGNIVRLRKPYKPGDWSQDRPKGMASREEWDAWKGYTHGIIVEVLERTLPQRVNGGRFAPGAARRVSLHLYDPERALLYIPDCYTVPSYVDFHVDELRPHKIATDPGYTTLPDLDGVEV